MGGGVPNCQSCQVLVAKTFGFSGPKKCGVGQSRQGPRYGRHDEYIRAGLVESTPLIWITSWSKVLGSEVHTPIEAEGVPSEVPRRGGKVIGCAIGLDGRLPSAVPGHAARSVGFRGERDGCSR